MEFPRNMYGYIGLIKISEFSIFMSALFVSENVDMKLPHIFLLLDMVLIPLIGIIAVLCAKYYLLVRYRCGLQVCHVILCVLWLLSGVIVLVNYMLHVNYKTYETVLLVLMCALVLFVILELLIFIIIIYKRITYKANIPNLSDIDLTHPLDIVSVSKLNLVNDNAQPSTSKRRGLSAHGSEVFLLSNLKPTAKEDFRKRNSRMSIEAHYAPVDLDAKSLQDAQNDTVKFAVTAHTIHEVYKASNKMLNDVFDKASTTVETIMTPSTSKGD